MRTLWVVAGCEHPTFRTTSRGSWSEPIWMSWRTRATSVSPSLSRMMMPWRLPASTMAMAASADSSSKVVFAKFVVDRQK